MKKGLAWALVGAAFALLWTVSFLGWANLTIDGGREMNTPLRLLNGETLYSDVYYLYGPFAPFVNAALYRLFGIHLNTLYFAGTLAAVIVTVLVFRLGAALGGTTEALLAAWAVVVLCIFKQNGNYIFPYAYAAVYGTLLGLAALVALVAYVDGHRSRDLIVAGLLAGLALVCKLEFGIAALAGLLAAAFSERPGRRLRALVRGLGTALLVALVTYGALLSRIPFDAVITDTFLWPGDIPAELVYFNRLKLGLHDPWKTIRELANAVALVGILAVAVVLVAAAWAARSPGGALTTIVRPWRGRIVWTGAASVAAFFGSGLIFGTRWDVSPLRALPVLCAAAIAAQVVSPPRKRDADARRRALLVVSVYGLVVLGRVVLRVPSGGAYGAYLLPVPLVLFTHLAMTYHQPLCGATPACARRARQIVVTLFALTLTAATVVIAYRYLKDDYALLATPRGSVRLAPPEKEAFDAALAFIAAATKPGEYVWAVPEGSSLNFLANRPAPLRHEILTPGFLDPEGERRAVERLEARSVKIVLVLHRPMVEFGCGAFGRDCYRELMRWIEANYRVAAQFGPRGDGALITVYERE